MIRTGIALVVLALVGCAGATEPAPAEPAPAVAEPATPEVITTLRFQTHSVSALVGGAYSVSKADGTLLASNLTAVEFRTRFPSISEQYQEAVANLDASADVVAPAEPFGR